MNATSNIFAPTPVLPPPLPTADKAPAADSDDAARDKFNEVMGEMLLTQVLKSMRKTVGKPAYFDGGPAEEMFTQQLDQVLAQKIAKTSGDKLLGSMYDLSALGRP